MDGLQGKLRDSIRLRLSVALSVVILAVAVVAGLLSFRTAFMEANELQDDILEQVAALMRPQDAVSLQPGVGAGNVDPESRLIVQRLFDGPAAPAVAGANPRLPTLPVDIKNGLHTIVLQGMSYRVLVKRLDDDERIAVMQETTVRDEIARNSAFSTVLPLLVLMPILLLLAGNLVQRMLKPVVKLAATVDRRDEQNLQPLPEHDLPTEIMPFIKAINRLLVRVARSIDTQQRFVADAAHELRSPMTALSLQAERLDNVELSGDARERLLELREGIERGRRLLDQLLSLARAQSSAEALPLAIPLQKVSRRILEDLMPFADSKGIDLGVRRSDNALVAASELDLLTIARNLVDNAIRYTPPGGRVDLSVAEDGAHAVLEVEDNGKGIPVSERSRVLDPFYRVLGTAQAGSGLGLSIVKSIVERLHGSIEIADSTEFAQGLKVRVILGRGTESPGGSPGADPR